MECTACLLPVLFVLLCSLCFFFVADTALSSGHLASGVHGHSGLESMYSMNWVTYSFMRARHVSMQGTLGGGRAIRSYCTRYAVV